MVTQGTPSAVQIVLRLQLIVAFPGTATVVETKGNPAAPEVRLAPAVREPDNIMSWQNTIALKHIPHRNDKIFTCH